MLFEKAARRKLRFTHKGSITAEDLWDLKLEDLDGIYRKLRKEQDNREGESLLRPVKADKDLNLSVDVVRRVVEVKLAEKQARQDRAEKRQRRDRLREVLAQKQDESLKAKSEEELAQLLAQLDDEED